MLFGGSLIPFKKDHNSKGVTPIVVSDVFSRLSRNRFSKMLANDMRESLGPSQCGVHVTKGAEKLIQAFRKFWEDTNGQKG